MIRSNLYKIYNAIDKPSLFLAICIAVYSIIQILNYIGLYFSGNYQWLFMPSEFFGIPQQLRDALGLTAFLPSYDFSYGGWDGQFYHYISNDIFGVNGYADNVDSPAYRWQRIGFPLFAKILSLLMFSSYVSVPHYISANILLLSAAVYIFAKYLRENNISILWVLPWALCAGLQVAMRHGLVDAAGDAFFIIAFVYMLRKNYWVYAIAMTFACLSRESYVIIAFVFFLLIFFGKLDDRYKFNFKITSIFAIPGIIFILWFVYVSVHFGNIPAAGTGGRITNLFLASFFKYFIIEINNNNQRGILFLYTFIVVIAYLLFTSFKGGFKNPILWAFFPYTILLASFGPTVMSHWTGYMKAVSSMIAMIPIAFILYYKADKAYKVKIILGIILAISTISGVYITFTEARGYGAMYPYSIFSHNPMGSRERGEALTNTDSSIKIINCTKNIYSNIPFSSIFTRDYLVCDVEVENRTGKKWQSSPAGRNAVYLSYKIYDKNGQEIVTDGIRNGLPHDIENNTKAVGQIYIILPKKMRKGEDYNIRVSLLQEEVIWFFLNNHGFEDIKFVAE